MKFIKVVENMLKKISKTTILVLTLIVLQACSGDATDRIKIKSLDIEAPEIVKTGDALTLQIANNLDIDSLQIEGSQPASVSDDKRNFTYSFSSAGVKKIQLKAFADGEEWQKTISLKVIPPRAPEKLDYEIVKTLDHARDSYTQGLEFYNGKLYESKGQYGTSSIRKLDFPSMQVVKDVALGSDFFGEGLTILNDTVYQITWREKLCFLYDTDLRGKGTMPLPVPEGWGISNDGSFLFISDGSNRLYRLDKKMKYLDNREIYAGTSPLSRLNELERVKDRFYANVYQSDQVFRIDYETGTADAMLDLSELRTQLSNPQAEVLNGIAYIPERELFLVTGKYWDKAFLIRVIGN